ncbi:hypothetical protein LJC56_01075 [Christensenellaceae bacterium OttesenSCG-928-K19]|nr:hypothetical protein [Christensenellaceae bacterium OttesenSCG-928-K19]
MDTEKKLKYLLTEKSIKSIFRYLIVLLLIGICGSIYVFIKINEIQQNDILLYTIIVSISVCLMFCSIKYIRKLYLACIESRIERPEDDMIHRSMGVAIYFYLRPAFAVVFVIIAIFAMLAGLLIVTSSLDYVLNNKFLYLSVIVSSFIGYSIGSVMDRFGDYSQKQVEKTFNQKQ